LSSEISLSQSSRTVVSRRKVRNVMQWPPQLMWSV